MKNTSYFGLIKKLSALLFLLSIISGNLPVFGQTRRPSAKPVAKSAGTNSGCKGGWRGVVTLRKILKDSFQSDEPGIRKSIDRIKHVTSRDYQYSANAVVTDANPYTPKVTSKVKFSDKNNQWGEERVFDTCNSREKGHWFIIEGTDNRVTTAEASGPADSFNLSVDELSGTYQFGLEFPDAKGTYNREEHIKRSGHCQAKNNEPYDRSTNEATKIDGESVSITGAKMDPNDPNVLQGSKTWGDDGRGQVRSFVYIATWYFTRCPENILITDLRFEHMKFPAWNNWQEIVEQNGTIDGNLVRITAQVANLSAETKFVDVAFKETYKGDKWDGARPDYPLKSSVEDLGTSVKLDAGEVRDVEVLWDSQGFAWFDDGRPRLLQRIKAEAWENFKLKDSKTKNLKVSPKPLVLVTGLWSDVNSFSPYQNYLTLAHSYGWKAVVFDDNITGEQPKNVFDYADSLDRKVMAARQDLNAWHIDIAAHSSGGLVARAFVHKFGAPLPDGEPLVKNLMMMGSPNLGVACTGSLESEFKESPAKLRSAKELFLDEMQRFNQYVVNRNGTKFSALVGRSGSMLCAPLTKGDGVVEVESASAGIEDITYASEKHANLTESKYFGNFIRPHVITGPRGTYPIPAKSE